MPKLPTCSGRDCGRALEKAGFEFVRQKGSHMIFTREDPYAQVVIPNDRELPKGTLRSIIRGAGLTVEAFTDLLKE